MGHRKTERLPKVAYNTVVTGFELINFGSRPHTLDQCILSTRTVITSGMHQEFTVYQGLSQVCEVH